MRIDLVSLPVYTTHQLSVFEHQLRTLTHGDSIPRTLAYSDFRINILKYQQTGLPICFKSVLPNYYFIEFENGLATLYRNVGTELDSEDHPDRSEDPPSSKRARC
jgi:hypothetical protein